MAPLAVTGISVSHSMSSTIDPPFKVYQDQLKVAPQGIALWNPDPPKRIYNNVSIGDVGYLDEGTFIRMFNVTLPWHHQSNRTLGDPEPYDTLGDLSATINTDSFGAALFRSSNVTYIKVGASTIPDRPDK